MKSCLEVKLDIVAGNSKVSETTSRRFGISKDLWRDNATAPLSQVYLVSRSKGLAILELVWVAWAPQSQFAKPAVLRALVEAQAGNLAETTPRAL